MAEEIKALRGALAEREEQLSKMRIEIHQSSTRVIDFKVFFEIH